MRSAIAVAVADAAFNEMFHVESSNSIQRISRLTEARDNSWLGRCVLRDTEFGLTPQNLPHQCFISGVGLLCSSCSCWINSCWWSAEKLRVCVYVVGVFLPFLFPGASRLGVTEERG